MQPWLAQLGAERVRNVVVFVMGKKNTHVPGKEAEGKKYPD